MLAVDVSRIIRRELDLFQIPAAAVQTLGTPWSSARWMTELDLLRQCLIEPRRARVHIADSCDRSDGFVGVKELWVVTRVLENSYVVVYDPDLPGFGLAVAGETVSTAGVWGDLPSTFAAR